MKTKKTTSNLQSEIETVLAESLRQFKFKPETKLLSFTLDNCDLDYKRLYSLSQLLKTDDISFHFESDTYEYCECCGTQTDRTIDVTAREVQYEDK